MVDRFDGLIEETLNSDSSGMEPLRPAAHRAKKAEQSGAVNVFGFSDPAAAHVWSFDLELPTAQLEQFSQTLSAQELERAARFHFDHHRARYIAAHGWMRQLLAHYLSVSASDLEFKFSPRGKPFLSGPFSSSTLAFNLAHSDAQGLLAVSNRFQVGADIERVRPMPDAQELVARFFSRRETEQFAALPEEQRAAAFFNLWTRKEAWLKATGEGIAHLLAQVEVSFLPEEGARLLELPREYGASAGQWSLRSMAPLPGFIGAVAAETPELKPLLRRWDGQPKEVAL
jgi:4'-phosphopantetheinyl transferase